MDASGIPIASTSSNDSASETPLYLALGKYSVIIGRPSCLQGFPCGSAGKESTCNVGDLNPIPGLGRFPGEGKGYPLQYSGLENSKDYSPWGCKETFTLGQIYKKENKLGIIGSMLVKFSTCAHS